MVHNPRQRGPGGPQSRPEGIGEPDFERLLTPDRKVDYFEAGAKAGQRRTIRAALLDEDARAVAMQIRDLPASQLRRFYASVISLKRELEVNPAGTTDALVMARLALLKAHTAYAKKRMPKMPDAFVKFIVRHVASVETQGDFVDGFAPCFEAVVAYHKWFEIKQRGA